MPRKPRVFEAQGYLHIIVRGNAKQIIFECDGDYLYYISLLEKYSEETGVRVCAYCLMSNHVHLLVYYENDSVPVLMKKLGVAYTSYYNWKYDRVGHLFQGRYRSELVMDERYYLTVFRYILNNPVKAGICEAAKYKWSSFDIFSKRNHFVDTSLILELVGGHDGYIRFMGEPNSDECMEYESMAHNDKWAIDVMNRVLGIQSGNEIKTYDKIKRDVAIRKLKENGLSQNQIARITGLGRGVIQKA